MAIYLDIFNLIINKKAITEKYIGGLERFREDFDIPASEINHEDGLRFLKKNSCCQSNNIYS